MKIGLGINNNYNFTGNRKKTNLFDKNSGKNLTTKDGIAYLGNEKFSGVAVGNNKKGNNIEIGYQNGKLAESKINGEILKTYIYPKDNGMVHYFNDGSYLDEKEYYGFSTPDVTVIYDGDSVLTIHKYKNPRYKNEPILDYNKTVSDKIIESKRIIKETGEEIKEFKSLEEAEKHFLDEYGIKAEFVDISQAQIVKNAIEDFMKLNIKKDAFKGLKILIDSERCYDGALECEDSCGYIVSEDSDNTDNYTFDDDDISDEKGGQVPVALYECELDETFDILDKTKDKNNPNDWDYMLINPTIFLNSEYDWSSVEDANNSEEAGYSSYSTLRGDIQHEFSHFLHSKYSAPDFFYPKEDLTEKEIETMEEVSYYAGTSPLEFVAEYIPGRIEGKKYSKEVNELYKKFGGPDIFKD